MRSRFYISVAVVAVAIFAAYGGYRALSPSMPFRDCADCPLLVSIPGGVFTMGIPPTEQDREFDADGVRRAFSNPRPQQQVAVSKFALASRDVTRREFELFVQETGHRMRDRCYIVGSDDVVNRFSMSLSNDFDWQNPGFQQTDGDPAVCVSWDDANAYTAWLSKKTGKDYRLPTAAEWEYAARAGSTTARFWGDDRAGACEYANVFDLTAMAARSVPKTQAHFFDCSDGFVHTAPVGSFKPNAFGLHDMLGNVWQWVQDCGPNESIGCGARGGSWASIPSVVRSGLAWGFYPNEGWAQVGFRVARSE